MDHDQDSAAFVLFIVMLYTHWQRAGARDRRSGRTGVTNIMLQRQTSGSALHTVVPYLLLDGMHQTKSKVVLLLYFDGFK